jgi:hypothetical protein
MLRRIGGFGAMTLVLLPIGGLYQIAQADTAPCADGIRPSTPVAAGGVLPELAVTALVLAGIVGLIVARLVARSRRRSGPT